MKSPLAEHGKISLMGMHDLRGKLIFTLVFTLLHLLLTTLLFLLSFSAVMSNADDGKLHPLAAEILYQTSQVLLWPVFIPLGRIEYLRQVLPVYSGIFILLLNSAAWAICALLILVGWQHLLRRKKATDVVK